MAATRVQIFRRSNTRLKAHERFFSAAANRQKRRRFATAATICFEGYSKGMGKSVFARRFIAAGMMTALLGCASNPFEVTISNCPAVAVVSYTGTLTRFKGRGRNTSDVTFNATITDLRINCVESDKRGISQQISFAIIATKGPAFSGEVVTLPYFALLIRDNSLITVKKVFEAELRFDPVTGRAVVRQSVLQTLEDLDIARRYDYELLIGFQLTPDEVAYNALR